MRIYYRSRFPKALLRCSSELRRSVIRLFARLAFASAASFSAALWLCEAHLREEEEGHASF